MGRRITEFAVKHPKLVLFLALLVTAATLVRAGNLRVDTDPENMLDEDEEVRIFHNEVKRAFDLSDMLVLGVVNETHPDGVFNPETLGKVYRITQGARAIDGVVVADLMAPSTVDDILQAGPGAVRFRYLMERPPETREEALHLRDRAMANPLLHGTLVSEDGKALALYVPIVEKKIAHRVGEELRALVAAEPPGGEAYHLTGLPVAEDTFGVEMFRQMAVSAPLAGLVIFLLLLFFFRKLTLVVAPMVVALLTVVATMGALVSTGNTVHIMSSMIPIFLMPIAVVDSVHILSMFFDRYQLFKDRARTLHAVMEELFAPMLYTSLTTFAGFASLALTPIPPVQVFGLFVGLGVGLAWLLTVTVVPAYILLFIPERALESFGATAHGADDEGHSPLARLMVWTGRITQQHAKAWLALTAGVIALSVWGISRIQINDNPVKWFVPSHPIRVADEVLNRHFGGTYEAYLVFEPPASAGELDRELAGVRRWLEEARAEASPAGAEVVRELALRLEALAAEQARAERPNPAAVLDGLVVTLGDLAAQAPGELAEEVELLAEDLEDRRTELHTFKDPKVLRWVEGLQEHLASHRIVGKSNGLTDVVKKVHGELFEGRAEAFRIPDSPAAVAQTILSYQSSHNPEHVWHLVTPDFRHLNLWVQLQSGDNKDMEAVLGEVEAYLAANPPPLPLDHAWAGLTYLNVVWQDRMVKGMLTSLLGSFAVVLVMMTLLFRSVLWGLLSMIPLSVTIAFIYGLIGLVGKDYDMPVAVLSSLTLGMSIDFAIHYLQRCRECYRDSGSWARAAELMSLAPSRAIARNAVVIAVGFLPLLLAPLVPYRTVGFFLATIMGVSAVATVVILPSLAKLLQARLFRGEASACEIKTQAA
ncbi:MAG: MMPL family transporter [Deferrisomatales bacterium]|nr:MMPL family transporter [Deferrisomatales bacterium]